MYRAYDTATKEFLTVKLRGKDVPLVGPVPPQRAFAQVRSVIDQTEPNLTDPLWVPYPYVSFTRMNPIAAQNRFQRADIRKLGYSDDMNRTLVARRPMPWDIPYQIDIWAEMADDAYYLAEAYQRKWRGPITMIDVEHGKDYGHYHIGVRLDSVVDNSELESDEKERLFRITLSITLEGFMSFPPNEVPTVRRVNTEVWTAHHPNGSPEVYNDYEFTIFDTEEEDE